MISLLQVLVEAVHLICVNFAAAAPLLAAGLEWRSVRTGDARAAWAARRLAQGALLALGGGALLGLTMAGVLYWQLGSEYAASLRRLPTSRYGFAAAELGFYAICVGAILALVPAVEVRAPLRRWAARLLALAASTNVLYHFPPLFAVLVGLRGEPAGPVLSNAELKALRLDPLVLALLVHHVLAALAVTGAGLMLLAAKRPVRDTGGLPGPDPLMRIGAWTALVPTLLQWIVGMVVLAQLSPAGRGALLGGDLLATALFGLALFTTLGLLHLLAAAAFGPPEPRAAWRAAAMLALVILLMVGTLQRARAAERRSNRRKVVARAAATQHWEKGPTIPRGALHV
ncbi:MAG: hypothetical protein U0836_26410 [Pirellulales bacterium]